ncbi:MAG: hypothetical protein PVH26_02670 [Desulfosarcina sp.]
MRFEMLRRSHPELGSTGARPLNGVFNSTARILLWFWSSDNLTMHGRARIGHFALENSQLSVDRLDHDLALPHQIGKMPDDFIAIAVEKMDDLPDRAWLRLHNG